MRFLALWLRRLGLILLVALPLAFVLFFWIVGQASPTCAGTADAKYGAAVSLGRFLLRQIQASYAAPGISVAVMVDGALVWSEGFGYADAAHRTPVCRETQFRIGSVSKPLTAVAVGQLYEQGRLSLDAPVQRYVDFPDKGYVITPRQLAAHLSGIRNYVRMSERLDATHYPRLSDALLLFAGDPLVAPAGTQFRYSSYGYDLLGMAVEGASGEAFPDYMQNHLLGPLGLNHTVPDDPTRALPDRAAFFEDTPRGIEPAPFVDLSGSLPADGYLSTPEDLAWFGAALLQGRVLKPETVEALFTPECPDCPGHTRGEGYGLGWGIEHDPWGRRVIYHTGSPVGGTAALYLYPEQALVLAFATNVGSVTHPDPQPHAYRPDLRWVADLFLAVRDLSARLAGN